MYWFTIFRREMSRIIINKTGIFALAASFILLFGFSILVKSYAKVMSGENLVLSDYLKSKMKLSVVAGCPPDILDDKLKSYGFKVENVRSIEDAIDMFNSGECNLIISCIKQDNHINITIYRDSTDLGASILVTTLLKAIDDIRDYIITYNLANLGLINTRPGQQVVTTYVHTYTQNPSASVMIGVFYMLVIPLVIVLSALTSARFFLLSYQEDFSSSFYLHLFSTPVGIGDYIIGKSLPYFMFSVIWMILNFMLSSFLFRLNIHNLPLLLLTGISVFSLNLLIVFLLLSTGKELESLDMMYMAFLPLQILVYIFTPVKIWENTGYLATGKSVTICYIIFILLPVILVLPVLRALIPIFERKISLY